MKPRDQAGGPSGLVYKSGARLLTFLTQGCSLAQGIIKNMSNSFDNSCHLLSLHKITSMKSACQASEVGMKFSESVEVPTQVFVPPRACSFSHLPPKLKTLVVLL